MRPDLSWSMSTAGLSAQEIRLPTPGCPWHSMAGAKPSWKYHELQNLYFALNSSPDYNLSIDAVDKQRPHLPSPTGQPLPPKKHKPVQLTLPTEPCRSGHAENDQVVPCFQRLTVSDHASPPQTPSRLAKPLPPIPGSAEFSPDQAMDSELEFFSANGDDSRCLVSATCSKHFPFRYGASSRRSFRDGGQINHAYFEGPTPPPPQKPEPRQQERPPRKLRRSHSGPAGCFNKPRLQRAPHPDKPEVPPRVPLPPRPLKPGDYRRWSAEVSSGTNSDEDRPPKVPPRGPAPKSLPTYLNGVMPATTSFAPDPKYVSRGLRRQHSEGSPRILPLMENGRKASATHYFLMPLGHAHPGAESGLDWDCRSRRKATRQIDLV